ncbi:MAG: hypothetical protein JSV76_04175 [Candidatus Bathyarchaeota archaeon]|nr:MAG: hypothetical protein JSV76_04175 [Candidatus Bathyarchaeota archaeon]
MHLITTIIFSISLMYAPENNIYTYCIGFLAGAVTVYGFEELQYTIKNWVKNRKRYIKNHY